MQRENMQQSYQKIADYIDIGLRKYMLNVFSYMSAGLIVTAGVAYFASQSVGFVSFLYSSPLLFWLVALAPLLLSIYLVSRISSMSSSTAKALFFGYASLLGLSLSSVFLVYSSVSITNTFFVTAAMFLSMVIYGYSTDKDLSAFGSFLLMGLVGLIIAGIINVFTRSSVFSLVISAIGVIVFTGLTAYDTQIIKSYYLESDADELSEKKAILGALRLYLDFVNLFLYLLRFLGVTKSSE